MNCNLLQLLNKYFIFLTFPVLKLDKSRICKDLQLKNIFSKFIADEMSVFEKSIEIKEYKLLNE